MLTVLAMLAVEPAAVLTLAALLSGATAAAHHPSTGAAVGCR